MSEDLNGRRSAYRLALTFSVAACLLSCGDDGGDPCNDIRCDADCRIAGNQFGLCVGQACSCGNAEVCWDGIDNDLDWSIDCWDTDCGYQATEWTCNDGIDNDCDGDADCYDIGDCSSSPDCGGCVTSVCSDDCREAGWAGGSCVSDSCQCSDACAGTSFCPAGDICYGGVCAPPWGKSFTFVLADGKVPSGDWDVGSDPDPMACLTVDASTCCSPEATDNWYPAWNYECTFTVNSGSTWSMSYYDIDLTSDDTICTWDPETIQYDYFTWSGVDWNCGDGHVTVVIQW